MQKKSWLKRILTALGVIVVVVIVAVIGLILFLDPIIKGAIEKGAPAMLGCKATVEKVSVKPFAGRVMIRNLRLSGPEGYKDEVFSIEEFRVKIDVGSLLKKDTEPIIINEVLIQRPRIAYEVVGSKSNLDAIMAKLPQSDKPATPKDTKKPGRKVIIDHVKFSDGQVNVRALYTANQSIPLPLPSLELKDIGRASGGVTAVQAVSSILGSLISSVTELVQGSMKFLTDQAGKLGGAALDAGKATLDAGKDAGKAVLETGKDAVKGIKDLF